VPIIQSQVFVDMTTARTGLGRRIEAVNEMDKLAFAFGNVLQNVSKLGKGDVAHLATPELVHGLDVQRFQDDDVKAVSQIVGKVEEPIAPLVGNPFMHAGKVAVRFSAVVAALDFAGKDAVRVTDVIQASLKKLWRSNLFTGRQGEKGFQTEVYANDGVTQSGGRFPVAFQARLYSEVDEQFPQIVALDCDRLDRAENFPTLAELVDNALNADLVRPKQFPSRLLERKGGVLLDFAETWSCKPPANFPSLVLKEKLVAAINTLANVLDSLTPYPLPERILGKFFQLADVLLHSVHVDILPGQLAVPTMKRDAVIPDHARNVNLVMQVLILCASVQFEFQRFHASLFAIHRQLNDPECPKSFRPSRHEYGEDSAKLENKSWCVSIPYSCRKYNVLY